MNARRLFAVLATLLVLFSAPTVSAEGQSLSDTQIELIRQNCVTAQSSMQRLEQSEAVVRRNRGVGYESTLRLMAALNSRIAFNKLSAPELSTITANVEKKRAEFTENYISYNNSFTTTMKLPRCREQPVTFYDYLTQTRDLRTKLSSSIDDIDRLLDSYQKELDKLKTSVSSATTTQSGASQ